MNISIDDRWTGFVQGAVSDGWYQSEAELVEHALRLVQERDTQFEALRREIQAAIEEGGDGTVEDLDAELKVTAAELRREGH